MLFSLWLENILDPAVTWEGIATRDTKLISKVPLWKRIFLGHGIDRIVHTEWYCTRCGFDKIEHESVGKLKSTCPMNSEYACPLDIREINDKRS